MNTELAPRNVWPKWMLGLESEFSPQAVLQRQVQMLNDAPDATCIAGLTCDPHYIKVSIIPKTGKSAGTAFDLVFVHLPAQGLYPVYIESLVLTGRDPQIARDDEEFLLRLRDHVHEAIEELDL